MKVTQEKGHQALASVYRTQGSIYIYVPTGKEYIQKTFPSGNKWEEVGGAVAAQTPSYIGLLKSVFVLEQDSPELTDYQNDFVADVRTTKAATATGYYYLNCDDWNDVTKKLWIGGGTLNTDFVSDQHSTTFLIYDGDQMDNINPPELSGSISFRVNEDPFSSKITIQCLNALGARTRLQDLCPHGFLLPEIKLLTPIV